MKQINDYIPIRPKAAWKDKVFWTALAFIALISLATTIAFFKYDVKIAGYYDLEKHRVEKEREQIMSEKCDEPRAEYDKKFITFINENNLAYDNAFDSADRKDDPLYQEAKTLQVEKNLVEDACNEARSELRTVKEVSQLEFFKSHWRIVFN